MLINAGRRNNSGRLFNEPECSLGSKGSNLIRHKRVISAPIPIAKKVIRQPKYWPTMRPRGKPKTIASAVPVAIKLNACARFPAGAIRIARDAVIDQKIACAKATPMRLITRTVKLHDKNDSTWLAINTTNRQISNLRRSTWLVINIKGNDISATTHA